MERSDVTIVHMTLIQNIICCPVTLYRTKISSCVEFVAPSIAKLIKRYRMPMRLDEDGGAPLCDLPPAFSPLKPINMVIPAVTINTTRYLWGANLRRYRMTFMIITGTSLQDLPKTIVGYEMCDSEANPK